ncbi:Eukaryotic/viral aspartic protease [Phytophthora megakarya]|uniref:Eukaryotic/viral aspartic protease n=1 Tax=Phytophthora megakarya TaxID=4795 RepID=A0A225UKN9_9STRA|nr:Eukaryotic/viral aspartic protease [Phytophthora megakarya]
MRAKIRYSDGAAEEKREHVELFIHTLAAQEQELVSRLTLMEDPDTVTLEKKLRARQRGLAHQKKTLFVQMAINGHDSEREKDSDDYQICDQDRDDKERAKMFMTGRTSQPETARRDFKSGGTVHNRPKCRHCGSRRHSEGDCCSLLTCQKCAGQNPTDRCLRACKACKNVHEVEKCSLEEFFNQLRQWYDLQKHGGMLPPTTEKM